MALGKTVRELLRGIDSAEFSEWIAYSNIEPFGEERADLRQALTTAAVVNQWRDKNSTPAKPLDFMPYSTKPLTKQTAEEMAARLKMLQTGLNKHGNP